LEYVEIKYYNLFHNFRIILGISEAAIWASVFSILMKVFPKQATTISSFTETLFGVGYTLGNKQSGIVSFWF
jgi:MFS family permease